MIHFHQRNKFLNINIFPFYLELKNTSALQKPRDFLIDQNWPVDDLTALDLGCSRAARTGEIAFKGHKKNGLLKDINIQNDENVFVYLLNIYIFLQNKKGNKKS